MIFWTRNKIGGEKLIKEKTEALKKLQEVEGPHNVSLIKTLQQEIKFLLNQRYQTETKNQTRLV